jgi:acyl CoA:acetate/3-ketoacid CoA transferase
MSGKVLSFAAAIDLIAEGATVAVSASSGVSLPDHTLAALGQSFRERGRPGGLTLIFPINLGDMFGQRGLDHLSTPGQLACMIGGSYPSGPGNAEPPAIRRLIDADEVLAYNLPIGLLTQLVGDAAAKGPGVLSETGLDTFVDPAHGGGGMNRRSRAAPIVERLAFRGRDYLFVAPRPIDVAIIRATTADRRGNLTFEHEGALIAPYTLAAAAKVNRGKVIAQVKRVVGDGTLNPRDVSVPGYMVDAVVLAPDQMQATRTPYDPAISGQAFAPAERLPPVEDPIERLLSRRVAGQVRPGDVAVLGYGVCANIPTLLAGSGEIDQVSFVIEQGSVGGVPLTGFQFGCSYNAQAYLDTKLAFDYLRGGGFDVALLSFLQIDAAGNLNVSSLPSKPHITAGIGGFMDIVQNAPRLVFAGQLRGGGGTFSLTPDGLEIRGEGKHAKLVPQVDQVTVPGALLHRDGRSVRLVTERCTFELTPTGISLVEVIPGIDVRRQVLDLCAIPVAVAENLAVMDAALFADGTRPLLGRTLPPSHP